MSFHFFNITEVFSNANGTVQYIKFEGYSDNQDEWQSRRMTMTGTGQQLREFIFPTDLPTSSTNGATVLVATQGFANLGLVTPDFIIPAGFLFPGGGTLEFEDMVGGLATFSALPTNGVNAINFELLGEAVPGEPGSLTTPSVMLNESVGIPAGVFYNGSAANNTITAGAGHDGVFGNAGADILSGAAGNDNLSGGTGNDTIDGGDGNDTIEAGSGSDSLSGGIGNDFLGGDNGAGFGSDKMLGGAGNDTLAGDEANDTLDGGSGTDRILGGVGNDSMNGGVGTDNLNGEAGNDFLIWGAGDVLNGGAGTLDTLRILGAGLLDLSNNSTNPNTRLLNFEQVDLRAGAHTLKIAAADVLAMSPTDQIRIQGDAGDTVNIVGLQTSGGSAPAGFIRYTIGSAVLIIDSDVFVA